MISDETAHELVHEMFVLQRTVHIALAHAAADSDLGFAHEAVLRMVSQHEGCRAIDMATELGVGPSSLSRQIGELEYQGMVRRRTSETDKRAHLLTITEKGTRALAAIAARRSETLSATIGHWSDEEAATALTVLVNLTDAMRSLHPSRNHSIDHRTGAHS
ncbi:MarR family winged helix-turn-helix transcriptional regulator [Specibacter cremeus]|uniref:MarR family winged helix-turn-helix transcriptional regulator n=1 Tax=Specibacter cremeus TaxID=1629051 RepID=UPI0013DDB938|nr:MarR family transcriptional regulator [Specibacter cremeus]